MKSLDPDSSMPSPGSQEEMLLILGRVYQQLKDGNEARAEVLQRLGKVEITLEELTTSTRGNVAAVRCLERAMKDYRPMLDAIAGERAEAAMLAEEAKKAKATERSRYKTGVVIVLVTALVNAISAYGWFVANSSQRAAVERDVK